MKRPLLIVCIALSAIACNSGSDKDGETEDSSAVHITTEESDSMLLNSEPSIAIFKVITKNDAFSADQLIQQEEWTDDSLLTSSFNASASFIKDYRSVLRHSPDSSKILDIGSYNNIVTTNAKGQTILEGGDPDSEVALIDRSTNTRKRLLFTGPSGKILDGSWLNDHTVVFSGVFDEENTGKNDTLVWVVDLNRNLFKKFRSHQ